MKKLLYKFRDGMVIGAGILFVFGISNAWVDLGTVTNGTPLTETIWNDMVTKLNETGNRVSGIFTDGSSKVGIGTVTPAQKLHIASTGTPAYIEIQRTDGVTGRLGVGTSTMAMEVDGNNDLTFFTNSTEKMRIKDDGKVGIGTATPTAELEVSGTIKTDAYGYSNTASIMPNDMSYGAGGYSDGSTITLDMGVYLVKYYMCTGQNSFGASIAHIVSTLGTIDAVGGSYISSVTNGGDCGFFDSTILRVTSSTAGVNMRFGPYSSQSNTDNNPTANSVSATFVKIY